MTPAPQDPPRRQTKGAGQVAPTLGRYGLYAAAIGAGLLLIAGLSPHGRHGRPAPTASLATADVTGVARLTAVSLIAAADPPQSAAGARQALLLAQRARAAAPAEPSDGAIAEVVADGQAGAGRPHKLSPEAVMALADRCAPTAPAAVLASIVRVESGGVPLRIGVNGPRARSYAPASAGQAVALARTLIQRGESLDLGLAQINSANLPGLGLSLEDAFEPCRNLAAAAVMINRGYAQALKVGEANRPILETAYSIYNSGDRSRGLANGYAAKVEAARLGPNWRSGQTSQPR